MQHPSVSGETCGRHRGDAEPVHGAQTPADPLGLLHGAAPVCGPAQSCQSAMIPLSSQLAIGYRDGLGCGGALLEWAATNRWTLAASISSRVVSWERSVMAKVPIGVMFQAEPVTKVTYCPAARTGSSMVRCPAWARRARLPIMVDHTGVAARWCHRSRRAGWRGSSDWMRVRRASARGWR